MTREKRRMTSGIGKLFIAALITRGKFRRTIGRQSVQERFSRQESEGDKQLAYLRAISVAEPMNSRILKHGLKSDIYYVSIDRTGIAFTKEGNKIRPICHALGVPIISQLIQLS